MAFSRIYEARLKARQSMIDYLDKYIDSKIDEHELRVIIADYEAAVKKISEDDSNATTHDNN